MSDGYNTSHQSLKINGYAETQGRYISTVTVIDNYAVIGTDESIVCNKSTAMTVNLPNAVDTGRKLLIKNIGLGNVTVEGSGTDTIDGELNQVLNQWDCIEIIDYGTGVWIII